MTGPGGSRTDTPSNLRNFMGQQSNKIQKRRRRLAYLERQKLKTQEAAVLRAPKKKAAAPKKAPTEKKAPAPVAAAPVADAPVE